jgi:REP element-mobilizing transposase RayT
MKTKYNPNKHHRRSIRLKGYNYAQAGRYFVTFCVKDREHFFGEIINDEMYLNDAGIMIEKWYLELENKFPKIRCHEYVVMPNHFHAIVQIVNGADDDPNVSGILGESNVSGILGESNVSGILGESNVSGILGEHIGSPLPHSPEMSDEPNITNSPIASDGRGEPMCSPDASDEPNITNSSEALNGRGEPMCSPDASDESNITDSSQALNGRDEPMCSPETSDEPNITNYPNISDATNFLKTNNSHIEQGRHAGLPLQSLPQSSNEQGRHIGLPQQPSTEQSRHIGLPHQSPQQKPILGEHKDSPLWEVVQWFKTMSTNEYIRGVKTLNWERFNGKLWQRNYYEHIIRNDESCEKIATYIINNPKNWKDDILR